MAQTLTQYEYLDRNKILKGVCEWIVKESPILKKLPFQMVKGNAYKYNVETTLPTVSWLTVGDTITESTGTYTQRTADIYTLIGDSDTDKFAIATNATQDPEKVDVAKKAKAMAHEFELNMIMGQTTTASSTKQFKGLMRLLAELESEATTDLDGIDNSQVIPGHATSAVLTMAMMDELLDAIKPGKPDLLLMSRRMRRKLSALQRASGSGVVMVDSKDFGLIMPTYDTVPILVSDWIPDNLPDSSSSVLTISTYNQATARASTLDNSIIFALKLGEQDVAGLNAGEMNHERETFVESKNVIRNRFTWYCGLACFKKYSLAALINVVDTALE